MADTLIPTSQSPQKTQMERSCPCLVICWNVNEHLDDTPQPPYPLYLTRFHSLIYSNFSPFPFNVHAIDNAQRICSLANDHHRPIHAARIN